MPENQSFIAFLRKKAGWESQADFSLDKNIKQLNKEVKALHQSSNAGAEPDFSAAYQRVRSRESTFRKLVNRQLDAGEDILDSSVSMWLDEFREKKQQFLAIKTKHHNDKNKIYHKVLAQEDKTHEMLHGFFSFMNKTSRSQAGNYQPSNQTAPLALKLAGGAVFIFVLALSLARLTPNLSRAIITASDSLTVKPLEKSLAWLNGSKQENFSPAPENQEIRLILQKDQLAGYIEENHNYISASAGDSGRVYINKEELAHSQQKLNEETRVLAETYDYNSLMNRLKRGVKDLILDMADRQKKAVDIIEEKLTNK